MLNGFSTEFLNIPGGGVGAQIGVVNVRSERRFRRVGHESAGEEVLDHLPLLLQLVHCGVEFALTEGIELDTLHNVKLAGDVVIF